MKLKAIIATSGIDSDYDRFSPEALEEIANSVKGKSIKIEFKHDVGHIEDAEVIDGSVHVSGRFDVDLEDLQNANVYLVPTFGLGTDDWDIIDDVRVIRHCTLVYCGLTDRPVDENLTPIEVIDAD